MDEPPPLASLRASLGEQLAQVRGAPVPDALIDVALQRFSLSEAATAEAEVLAGVVNGTPPARREARPARHPTDDDLVIVRPRDWQRLRESEAAAGRPTPYWAVPWPSGHVLARAVARAERSLDGTRVLELGCGLALPSVAAARAGAQVLATDASPDAVVFAAHDLALNDAVGDTAVLDWRDVDALAARGPFALVLAADVLYTRAGVEALLALLPAVLAPGGEAWVADPGRSGAAEFLPVARRVLRLLGTDREPEAAVHRLGPR